MRMENMILLAASFQLRLLWGPDFVFSTLRNIRAFHDVPYDAWFQSSSVEVTSHPEHLQSQRERNLSRGGQLTTKEAVEALAFVHSIRWQKRFTSKIH